jgi:diketogulonate reductase-like aldo/keto reductase
MLPLTGTTDGTHMRHNLDIFDFTLTRDETGTLLALGGSR